MDKHLRALLHLNKVKSSLTVTSTKKTFVVDAINNRIFVQIIIWKLLYVYLLIQNNEHKLFYSNEG